MDNEEKQISNDQELIQSDSTPDYVQISSNGIVHGVSIMTVSIFYKKPLPLKLADII